MNGEADAHTERMIRTCESMATRIEREAREFKGVWTDAQGAWWSAEGIGTVPHALIAAYGGDTAHAAKKFAEHMSPDVQLVTLVDFDNRCVDTALEVARALGDRLYGVRLDTSEMLVDESIVPQMGAFRPTGVNAQLVHNVRQALDREGFASVTIVASGGFTAEKIQQFEAEQVPVEAYGVGSSLLDGKWDFTADIVRVDGRPCSKVGRSYNANPRLELVT